MAGNSKGRRSSPHRLYIIRTLSAASLAFMIALFVSAPSQAAVSRLNFWLAFPVLLIIILIGVLFDMIGVAATAAEERPFHAMAAKKIAGARQTIRLVRRADRIASFANDIVGDIAASISGAAGAAIAFRLASLTGWNPEVVGTTMIGLVAAGMVGGKAAMKTLALNHANDIMFSLGKILYWVERLIQVRPAGNIKNVKKGK